MSVIDEYEFIIPNQYKEFLKISNGISFDGGLMLSYFARFKSFKLTPRGLLPNRTALRRI